MQRNLWLAYRLLTAGLLLAWGWNAPEHWQSFDQYRYYDVVDPFFPQWAKSGLLGIICYASVMGLSVLALFINKRPLQILHSSVVVLASALLALSAYGFAFQGFVTGFWGGLWLLWVAINANKATVEPGASNLGQAIISFTFLGAVAGKLCEPYWSGEALFHMVFTYQSDSKFVLLRELLSAAQLSSLAGVHGKLVILAEGLLSLLFLFPKRIGAALSFALLLGMWVASPLGIINAIGPLLGLSLALTALAFQKSKTADVAPQPSRPISP